MKSLSLIQAIFLLNEKERKGSTKSKDRRIDRLIVNPQNLAKARKLAHHVLGQHLRQLPRQSKVLFLLIEQMAEKQCAERKIEYAAFRFTRETIRISTGWSDAKIKLHLSRLESFGYLVKHRDEKKQLSQYEILYKRRSF